MTLPRLIFVEAVVLVLFVVAMVINIASTGDDNFLASGLISFVLGWGTGKQFFTLKEMIHLYNEVKRFNVSSKE